MALLTALDRRHTIAPSTYNRWLIPPAALAVHLCIGQVYATSVYKTSMVSHFGTSQTAIGVTFSIAIVMLGLSAAVGGTWVERNGPRKAMFVAACFWGAGFLIGALGIATKQLWLLYLGYGVVGGIGLGIGYISPVSTLIKWFPDRPGLATGMAIMGFGGGALVASPLSRQLLSAYDPAYDPSVATSIASGHALTMLFVTLGIGYFAVMMLASPTCVSPRPAGPGRVRPVERQGQAHGHHRERLGGQRHPHAAVLAAVGRVVLQRDRRHRHPRAGSPMIQDFFRENGTSPWPSPRPAGSWASCRCSTWPAVRVVLHLGRHRAQADLHALPRRRHCWILGG